MKKETWRSKLCRGYQRTAPEKKREENISIEKLKAWHTEYYDAEMMGVMGEYMELDNSWDEVIIMLVYTMHQSNGINDTVLALIDMDIEGVSLSGINEEKVGDHSRQYSMYDTGVYIRIKEMDGRGKIETIAKLLFGLGIEYESVMLKLKRNSRPMNIPEVKKQVRKYKRKAEVIDEEVIDEEVIDEEEMDDKETIKQAAFFRELISGGSNV